LNEIRLSRFQAWILVGCIELRFQEIILTKKVLKILNDFVRLYWLYEILRDFFQKTFFNQDF
jgi:hypothetical protein